MKAKKWLFNASDEEIKEALARLPEMVNHPGFPFGRRDLFESLAQQVLNLSEAIAEAPVPEATESEVKP